MGLLIAWSQLNQENWELHLIGADYEDNYSRLIKEFITINNLQKTVKLLGTRQGVSLLLNQASIGVLASNSEGLPLALIEYGAASLAVISTDVGQCKAVIGEHGIVVNTNSSTELSEALSRFMLDKELRILKAKRFSEQIKASFTEIGAIPKLIDYYSSL
jgi:glycosyltransferase involved in cell wall biosynthesis